MDSKKLTYAIKSRIPRNSTDLDLSQPIDIFYCANFRNTSGWTLEGTDPLLLFTERGGYM